MHTQTHTSSAHTPRLGDRLGRKGKGDAPELPFGEAADERAELVVARGGEGRRGLAALFNLVGEKVFLEGGVEAGLEEGKEEVEEVDCVGVCSRGGQYFLPTTSSSLNTYSTLQRSG